MGVNGMRRALNQNYYADSTMSNEASAGFAIDPVHFSVFLLSCLFLFVVYLLLPRGFRVHHFRAYPKRYAWSARSRAARRSSGRTATPSGPNGQAQMQHNNNHRQLAGPGIGMPSDQQQLSQRRVNRPQPNQFNQPFEQQQGGRPEETVTFSNQQQNAQRQAGAGSMAGGIAPAGTGNTGQMLDVHQNDEIVISAAMQQLREPGVLIVAHGSKGKPKTVRLQLSESAITWRTETRKKVTGAQGQPSETIKMGKLHSVPLSHIMYVDVGKQTTALRRVENAHVSESLCFSLLTKEGSLDLEANTGRERDALVSCFSLVLDEIHAQNWRDIYRGPSSDMPSSFDEFEADPDHQMGGQQQQQQG
mmetsp:Transcript_9433/g.9545  ORF Transcript_9433/g.9545 Transcript_9433/m.9545 type:complete len:361 (-) Transcript_9433:320-1402(-)